MKGEAWLTVETLVAHAASSQLSASGSARLIVLRGAANRPELLLSKTRTNIGRTAEVFRGPGTCRHNDLAFTEDSEENTTVSREHAHIVALQKNGSYRLFNDRIYKGDSNCGLWIVRDGLSQPVHRGPRGTPLKSGDEIHLGTAVLQFLSGEQP